MPLPLLFLPCKREENLPKSSWKIWANSMCGHASKIWRVHGWLDSWFPNQTLTYLSLFKPSMWDVEVGDWDQVGISKRRAFVCGKQGRKRKLWWHEDRREVCYAPYLFFLATTKSWLLWHPLLSLLSIFRHECLFFYLFKSWIKFLHLYCRDLVHEF